MATNYPTGITTQATVVWGGDGTKAVDVPVGAGGTAIMAAATAADARVAAGVDERGTHDFSAYAIPATAKLVSTSGAGAIATWTLPLAASVNPGYELLVLDEASGCSDATPLTVAAGTGNTVAGVAAITLAAPGMCVRLISDGVSAWQASAGGGVSPISGVNFAEIGPRLLINGSPTPPQVSTWSTKNLYVQGKDGESCRVVIEAHGPSVTGLLSFRISKGTAAAPTKVTAAMTVASLGIKGYGDTQFTSGAARFYEIAAAADFTDTIQPTIHKWANAPLIGGGGIAMAMTPDGTVRIGSNGNYTDLGPAVGSTTGTSGILQVQTTLYVGVPLGTWDVSTKFYANANAVAVNDYANLTGDKFWFIGSDGQNSRVVVAAYGGAAQLTFCQTGGTGAAPTATPAAGLMGNICVQGYGATSRQGLNTYASRAVMNVENRNNYGPALGYAAWTDSRQPYMVTFVTSNTPGTIQDGAGGFKEVAQTTRMRIYQNGAVFLGTPNNGPWSSCPAFGIIGDGVTRAGGDLETAGTLRCITVGKGLSIPSGTNAKVGTAVLAAGTVAVANTSVTANSLIFLTKTGATTGAIRLASQTAGVGFTITSENGADTATVNYMIVETASAPAPALFSAAPFTGPAAGGTAVTLIGTNLTGTTAVTFGGVAATSVVVVNDNTVTCVTPAVAAGVVDVNLTTPYGTTALTGGFTYA